MIESWLMRYYLLFSYTFACLMDLLVVNEMIKIQHIPNLKKKILSRFLFRSTKIHNYISHS